MKTAKQLLAEAVAVVRDRGRYADAKIAWNRYETRCWFDAHVERGLRICDLPREFRDGVFELVKIRQLQLMNEDKRAPKSLA